MPVPVFVTNFISKDLDVEKVFESNLDDIIDHRQDYVSFKIPQDGHGIFSDIYKLKTLLTNSNKMIIYFKFVQ